MNYRTLGKTGAKISEVGLGTWQLGASDWGSITEKDALAILHKAVEKGVSFLDTADVYGLGVSERTIGKFLQETHEEVHVATKLCRADWVRGGCKWPAQYTLEMTRSACQQSCRNLGVAALFLQQWHCPPTEWIRQGDLFEHMEQMKKEGLVRNWGVSVESVEEALLCMQHPGCSTLEVIYNIFRQKLTDELLPAAKKKNVGVLARVPLASGLLTGRFGHGHKFPEKDHRHYNADGTAFNVGETFAGVPFEKGVDLAEKIKAVLKGVPKADPDVHREALGSPTTDQASMAQLALRWILDHDAVSAVIPGATKLSQAESNAAASSLPRLSRAVHGQLRELYEKEIKPAIRGTY